jgi:serine protease inhibitor
MKKLVVLAGLLATTAQAGAPPPVDANHLARVHREFAIDLYRKLAVKDGNQFISPTSIVMALEMTRLGARGLTLGEMVKVLHLDELGGASNYAEGLLMQHLNTLGNKDLELTIANRLWGQKNVTWNPTFLNAVSTAFGGALATLDFGQPEPARKTINDWVLGATHQHIKDLLPAGAIDPSTRLVLTNAIYFKGCWVTRFDAKATTKGPFHAAAGDVTADLMHRAGTISALRDGHVTIAELPYKGGDLAMDLIVPDGPVGAFEQSLTADQLDRWFTKLASDGRHAGDAEVRVEHELLAEPAAHRSGHGASVRRRRRLQRDGRRAARDLRRAPQGVRARRRGGQRGRRRDRRHHERHRRRAGAAPHQRRSPVPVRHPRHEDRRDPVPRPRRRPDC